MERFPRPCIHVNMQALGCMFMLGSRGSILSGKRPLTSAANVVQKTKQGRQRYIPWQLHTDYILKCIMVLKINWTSTNLLFVYQHHFATPSRVPYASKRIDTALCQFLRCGNEILFRHTSQQFHWAVEGKLFYCLWVVVLLTKLVFIPVEMAGLKFYYDLISQPSRAVFLFLKVTNIPFVAHKVRISKGV